MVEYVFATRIAAARAAAMVPIPDLGPSIPGSNCGGRTAPATRAVSNTVAPDGSHVIRVPERRRVLEQESTARRTRVVSRDVRVADWERDDTALER